MSQWGDKKDKKRTRTQADACVAKGTGGAEGPQGPRERMWNKKCPMSGTAPVIAPREQWETINDFVPTMSINAVSGAHEIPFP